MVDQLSGMGLAAAERSPESSTGLQGRETSSASHFGLLLCLAAQSESISALQDGRRW